MEEQRSEDVSQIVLEVEDRKSPHTVNWTRVEMLAFSVAGLILVWTMISLVGDAWELI